MSAPLLRAWCAGPQQFIQSEKKLGKKLCIASLIDVTSVSRGWTNWCWDWMPKSGRGLWMTTACRQNSSTSGRGLFVRIGAASKALFWMSAWGYLVRAWLPGTCMIQQTLISLSFFALPCIKLRIPTKHHNHFSHCSYDSDGSPLWSPTAHQVVDSQSTGSNELGFYFVHHNVRRSSPHSDLSGLEISLPHLSGSHVPLTYH